MGQWLSTYANAGEDDETNRGSKNESPSSRWCTCAVRKRTASGKGREEKQIETKTEKTKGGGEMVAT